MEVERSARTSGYTLIELTIAIALMAIAVTAILAAWRFGIDSADRHRSYANSQTVLTSAGEAVGTSTPPVPDCAPPVNSIPSNYEEIRRAYEERARSVILPNEDGWTPSNIRVTRVDFWNGAIDGNVWSNTCVQQAAPAVSFDLRRVRIEVTSPDSRTTRTLEVVVRDV